MWLHPPQSGHQTLCPRHKQLHRRSVLHFLRMLVWHRQPAQDEQFLAIDPSRSREVARTRRPGAAASSSPTSGPTAGRCSQLSRTSSSARSRSTSRSSSDGAPRAPAAIPSAARIVPATLSACAAASAVPLMPTSGTQQAPAAKASRRTGGGRERQVGLAYAARAEQRHQASPGHAAADPAAPALPGGQAAGCSGAGRLDEGGRRRRCGRSGLPVADVGGQGGGGGVGPTPSSASNVWRQRS